MDKFFNKFIFNSYRMVWSCVIVIFVEWLLEIDGTALIVPWKMSQQNEGLCSARWNCAPNKIRFIIKLKSIDLNGKNLNNFGKPQIFMRPFSKHIRRHILSYPAISHPSPLSVIACPQFEASIPTRSQNNHVVVITGWYKNMALQ